MPDKDMAQVFCCPHMLILSLADTTESVGPQAISVALYLQFYKTIHFKASFLGCLALLLADFRRHFAVISTFV